MIEIRAHKAAWSDAIELLVVDKALNHLAFGHPITFSKVEQPNTAIQPTVAIDGQAAQRLMDELWNCGLRPSEGSGSAGQLAAVQGHLQDMRALVSKALDVKLQ